jgi:hypothetical protein
MALSFGELQVIQDMADHLYSFLPGKPHPYANQSISFPGAAREVGVGDFWSSGSKGPSITILLERTLDSRRDLFCKLILKIVYKALTYRRNRNPITREEIEQLNELILRLEFKIPELWKPIFLEGLPSKLKKDAKPKILDKTDRDKVKNELISLNNLEPIPRGFAFEKVLQELFAMFELAPRNSFRLRGEQIDGSFQLGTDTYLIEARWRKEPTNQTDLLVFREKVESKSAWSRGLFVSYNGFLKQGLESFSRGRSTNIIGMDGSDIYFILDGEISLSDAIKRKARRAAETGDLFVSVNDLCRKL